MLPPRYLLAAGRRLVAAVDAVAGFRTGAELASARDERGTAADYATRVAQATLWARNMLRPGRSERAGNAAVSRSTEGLREFDAALADWDQTVERARSEGVFSPTVNRAGAQQQSQMRAARRQADAPPGYQMRPEGPLNSAWLPMAAFLGIGLLLLRRG